MDFYNNDYLQHFGVKGMKWGVRKAKKYEAKAKKYRARAKEYDPKNHTGRLSSAKLKSKSYKYTDKAEKMDVKARLAREGKDDIKKLREARKLKGGYIDTQGLLRGPYADAVDSIRAKKGERYASALMSKHQNQEFTKFLGLTTTASVAYAVGMYALINNMD